MQPTDRPTPRTDYVAFHRHVQFVDGTEIVEVAPADFARELERECASLVEVGGELAASVEDIIRGAVHPEVALRRVIVPLEPLRAALSKWKKLRGEAR